MYARVVPACFFHLRALPRFCKTITIARQYHRDLVGARRVPRAHSPSDEANAWIVTPIEAEIFSYQVATDAGLLAYRELDDGS